MIPTKEKEIDSWRTAERELHIKNTTVLEFIRFGSESYNNHSGTYSWQWTTKNIFCLLKNSFSQHYPW